MTCKLGAILEGASPRRRALLEQCLADLERAPASRLAATLTAGGLPVGTTTIKDHRGKRCACHRHAHR